MPCDYSLLPHAGIRSLSPYIPGKSAEEVAREQGLTDIIKLASNENPLGCSSSVTKALNALTAKQVATYPIALNHDLPKKIVKRYGIESNMLILGNGSESLIPLILTCFALHTDKHILTHDYTFIAYSIHAKTLGIPVVSTPLLPDWQVDIDAMIAACNEKTALIFIATPNNPTGVLVNQRNIERLLQNIPASTILVVDEAYYEFVNDKDKLDTLSLLATYPNLIITRTFSKVYGLAGLRLGYAISHPQIMGILRRAQSPFTITEATLIGGSAAIDDQDFVQRTVKNNVLGLKQMQEGLTALGLNHLPTAANFIMFDCKMDTTMIFNGLQQHGIIVRPLHPYGLNNYLRVSIGTNQQNRRFLDILPSVLP